MILQDPLMLRAKEFFKYIKETESIIQEKEEQIGSGLAMTYFSGMIACC